MVREAPLIADVNATISLSRPVVSFCFDDFPRSALQVGGRLLESLGVRGTYYASMCFLEEPTPMGDGFTAADLAELVAQGHELGCHTFDHLDARAVDAEAYEASIVRNRRALARVLPSVTVASFAYPYGGVTPDATAAAARHSRSCRGTRPGINVNPVTLETLRAQPLYSRRTPQVPIGDLIQSNRQTLSWLIFYSHDVSREPSPWGCRPEFLEQVVGLALDSGATILPVGAARALVTPALA